MRVLYCSSHHHASGIDLGRELLVATPIGNERRGTISECGVAIAVSDFPCINTAICLTFSGLPVGYSDLAITFPPVLGLPASPAEVYDCVNHVYAQACLGIFLSLERALMLLTMADGDDGHGMGRIDPAIIHPGRTQHVGLALLQGSKRDLFITGLLWRRAA